MVQFSHRSQHTVMLPCPLYTKLGSGLHVREFKSHTIRMHLLDVLTFKYESCYHAALLTRPPCLSQCDSVFQWPQEKPCPKAWASLERVIEIQSKKRTRAHSVNFPSDEEKLLHGLVLIPLTSLALSARP